MIARASREKVVDKVEGPKGPPVGQAVAHEVHRPAFIHLLSVRYVSKLL